MKTPTTLEKLLPKAKQLANKNECVSTGILQRILKIKYSLAADLLDQLEKEGIIGPRVNSTLRKVIKRDLKNTFLYLFNNFLKFIRVSS